MDAATLTPLRVCGWCGITRTTQWRIGPTGGSLEMSTLCNACGINYRRTLQKVDCDERRLNLDVLAKHQGTRLSIGKAFKRQRKGLGRLEYVKRLRRDERVDVAALLCAGGASGAGGAGDDADGGGGGVHARCARGGLTARARREGEQLAAGAEFDDGARGYEDALRVYGDRLETHRHRTDANGERTPQADREERELEEQEEEGEAEAGEEEEEEEERLPSFRDFLARFEWRDEA